LILLFFEMLFFTFVKHKPYMDSALFSIFFTTFLFICGYTIIFAKGMQQNFSKILLIALLLLDFYTLIAKSPNVNFEYDPRKTYGTNELITWLQTHTRDDYSRVSIHSLSSRYTAAALFGLHQIAGYDGTYV